MPVDRVLNRQTQSRMDLQYRGSPVLRFENFDAEPCMAIFEKSQEDDVIIETLLADRRGKLQSETDRYHLTQDSLTSFGTKRSLVDIVPEFEYFQ
mmetsp:Transcript_25120/g.36786  ORF Transcript_25120/g.36786 Transcript_25120/m.36786 type:complete len:95 (+) Transcript_25120:995-1279(+)